MLLHKKWRAILCLESLCWQEVRSCLGERLSGIYCINVLWLILQKGSTFKEKSIKKKATCFCNGQEGIQEHEGNISIIDTENNKPWIIFVACRMSQGLTSRWVQNNTLLFCYGIFIFLATSERYEPPKQNPVASLKYRLYICWNLSRKISNNPILSSASVMHFLLIIMPFKKRKRKSPEWYAQTISRNQHKNIYHMTARCQ